MSYIHRAFAVLLVASTQVVAQERVADDPVRALCWEEWVAHIMKEVPRAEDTVSPATGRELSQTDGAKRTRALKYQAKKDALELRGKDDPDWKTYLRGCEMSGPQ